MIFTIGPYLLPNLIPILREQVPEMAIIIEEGFTADLKTKLNGFLIGTFAAELNGLRKLGLGLRLILEHRLCLCGIAWKRARGRWRAAPDNLPESGRFGRDPY